MKYGLFKPDTFSAVINTTTQINSAPGQNLDNSITSHVSKPIAAEHKLITVELVDKFIDLYLERNETILPGFNSVLLTVVNAVQQEIESRNIRQVKWKTFSGDPSQLAWVFQKF